MRRSARDGSSWAAGARSTIREACDYTYARMNDWGRRMFVTPGRGGRRQGRHQRPGGHQPQHPHPAGQLLLRRLGARRDVRHARSAGQPGRPASPLEPDDHPQAAEARLQRQVHLGDVAALVRREDQATTWRSTPAAVRSPGSGPPRSAGMVDSATSRRPATASRSTCPRPPSLPEVEFEWKIPKWSNAIERDRARTYFQAYAAAAPITSWSRR